ncbi:nucleotidyltransferase domain-containing protein [Patescibacteria group bacterium]|nr:nucleotidyltransferase domain-containing protein [Patescibacteria group bacterium]
MTKAQLKEKYKKEIKKMVKKIKEEYRPLKIYLFGSFVWGNFTEDSDVDFLIIKNSKKRKLDRISDVDKILSDREIPVDVLVYNPREIKERMELGDSFIEDVLDKGKLVYAK